MATIFPSSPTLNQVYQGYIWNGEAWKVIDNSVEKAQDDVASLFTHNLHTNVSATYDDENNRIVLSAASATVTAASKISQEVINNTGETLNKGQVVYASGAVGASGQLRVSLSSNSSESTSSKTFGILEDTILNGEIGTVVTEGLIEGLNTSTAQEGDPVWLGSTPGSLIFGLANKPVAPAHLVFIGIVIRAQQNTGSIFVKVQNGFEIDELHDVAITSPVNGSAILFNSTTGLWEDVDISTIYATINNPTFTGTVQVGSGGIRFADNSVQTSSADTSQFATKAELEDLEALVLAGL
jgi:hypothetical protein